jgi:hypothetical protein
VLEPEVPLPQLREEVLLRVAQARPRLALAPVLRFVPLPLLVPVLFVLGLAASCGPLAPWTWLAAPLLAGGVLHRWLLSPGRLWLTRERLVWKPRFGAAAQVRLASVSASDLELRPEREEPWNVELRVRGERPLAIRSLRLTPTEWVTLLRGLPQPHGEAPAQEDLVVLPASLVSGSIGRFRAEETHGLMALLDRSRAEAAEGLVVVRPGSLAYVPLRYSESRGVLMELLWRVRGMATPVVEGFVRLVVDHEEGVLFSPAEVLASPSETASGPGFRFTLRGQAVLLCAADGSQREAIARILARWRERPP